MTENRPFFLQELCWGLCWQLKIERVVHTRLESMRLFGDI